jgi:hypothetical protein
VGIGRPRRLLTFVSDKTKQLQTILKSFLMKNLKKLAIATVFAMCNLVGFSNTEAAENFTVNENTLSNSLTLNFGYGGHYSYRGESTIETRFQSVYNSYRGCFVQVRYQRQLNWFAHTETVYGPYGAYTNTYYTCSWSAWFQT